ncbi:MAG: beta-ketoacyl-[acyl-carrier-protein] synthase family protein, partial [Planctomycetaceae bacterium]|nr:beta-ketoacyl-[acyl-carrier-protein] synthase family protein [Planctomycetaceae bacterium]
VLITGLGMVTPLGISAEATWGQLVQGNSAGRNLRPDEIDYYDHLIHLLKRPPGGAPVDTKCVVEEIRKRLTSAAANAIIVAESEQDSIRHDPLNAMILAAAAEAVQHSQLSMTSLQSASSGCVIGTSKASLRAMEMAANRFRREFKTTSRAEAGRGTGTGHAAAMLFDETFFPDAPLRHLMRSFQMTGPTLCPVAACATGVVSVLHAAAMIRSGECDLCLAGSVDGSLRASVLSSFHRLGVTSSAGDPSSACRPFDRDRDGFIVGEGSAVLVLESRRHAERRAAPVLAQLLSGGWLTDCTGITQVDTNGHTVARLLSQMAEAAGGRPDYIHLHGTGTSTNDLAEAHGVKSAFSDSSPPCSGTKGATGHLLGAAGTVELALTVMSLRNNQILPTVNLQHPDPECDLPLVMGRTLSTELRTAAKLSLGFGGHVAGCLLGSRSTAAGASLRRGFSG